MKQQENKMPIYVLTQAIAYFLAGSFLIGTILPLRSDDGTLQPLNCFTFGIGVILILFGFSLAFTTPRSKLLTGFAKRLDQWSFWLFPILFAVAASQVVKMLIDFREIRPLFIITIIFLFIILLLIIFTSKRVFQYISSMALLILSFNVLALVLFFLDAEKLQVLIILFISVLCTFRLYYLITKKDKLQ